MSVLTFYAWGLSALLCLAFSGWVVAGGYRTAPRTWGWAALLVGVSLGVYAMLGSSPALWATLLRTRFQQAVDLRQEAAAWGCYDAVLRGDTTAAVSDWAGGALQQVALFRGDLGEAGRMRLAALLVRDPHNIPGRILAGMEALRAGRPGVAAAIWEQVRPEVSDPEVSRILEEGIRLARAGSSVSVQDG